MSSRVYVIVYDFITVAELRNTANRSYKKSV